MGPVKAVARPGATSAQPNVAAGQSALDKHVAEGDRKAEMLMSGGLAPLPFFHIILAIFNLIASLPPFLIVLLFVGLMSVLPMSDQEFDEAGGVELYAIVGGGVFVGLLYLSSAICCFTRGAIPWYTLTGSYVFGVVFAVSALIAYIMDEPDAGIIWPLVDVAFNTYVLVWLHLEDSKSFFDTYNQKIGVVVGVHAAFAVVALGIVLIAGPLF